VLEFNVRFGDPETQVVLPRWGGDVAAVLAAAAGGGLDRLDQAPTWSADPAVCVVLAAPGYPEAPVTGAPIEGLHETNRIDGVDAYAAGIGRHPTTGDLVTAGGRVLGLSARAPTLSAARRAAYQAAAAVRWDGMTYRRDIAAEAARKESHP
jgi:phosphoribosylamine--glycine ligase